MADYGTDIAMLFNPDGTTDLDPGFGLVTGVRVIAQALICRFNTPVLFYAPGDSVDVRQWLGRGLTPADIQRIQVQLEAQALQEEAVQRATATVAPTPGKPGWWTINVACVSSAGPFTLVLAASAAAVVLDSLVTN